MDKILRDDYWPQLREIPDPPASLWLAGAMPDFSRPHITIVGSRRMSRYGTDVIEYLVQGLADYPIVVVSGLALGVDAAVHRAALKNGITTIAFPGSGLSERALYPRTNVGLARDIIAAGGALVSEFAPEEQARQHFFPMRNRLMAGVAHAVVIIEAGEKSGTLITARLAVDYNRELLVVPHSIFSEGGAGGHLFMKIGARPVRSADEILEAVGIEVSKRMETLALTDAETEVLTLLASPMPRDELIRALELPTQEVQVLLATMELRGLIGESMGEIRKLI